MSFAFWVLHYSSVEVNPCVMATLLSRAKALLTAGAAAMLCTGALDGGPANAASVSAVYWATRANTSDRVLLIEPDQPTGAVMLLPGGHGNINLDGQARIGWGEDDFLVRTRMRYANSGLIAVVPDVATDHKPPASLAGFRTSDMQADDLHALTDRLRGMTQKVWIVAYDTGATSALNVVARGKADLIAGLVLISPVLEQPDPNSTLLIDGAKLALSRMPVLVIGHEFDECSLPVVDRIKNAAAVLRASNFQSIAIKGGREPYAVSDPFEYPENDCNARAHHALAGRDAIVSEQVIAWIGRQSAAAK
jgi:hypothetical protein